MKTSQHYLSPAPLFALLMCTACDPEPEVSATPVHERTGRSDEPVVVFESIRVLDRGGAEVSSRGFGELTPELYQRAGRPWSYFDEDHLYHEVTWSRPLADGAVEYGRQIIREVNPSPVEPEVDVTPTRVAPGITELLADATAAGAQDMPVEVHLRVRDFPDWDIPLMPPADFAADVRLRALADRDAALAARAELLDTSAATLIEDIEAMGGEVVARRPSIGWLFVRVPLSSLPRLVEHPDISRIVRPDGEFELTWNLGEGRQSARLDADVFWDHGFNGGRANPGRHDVGRIAVGVIDNGLDDEVCAFFDRGFCTGASRIHARFKCHNNPADYCQALSPGADFATVDENEHGTMVSSVLLGDYTDGQGCGQQLDADAPVPGCHSDEFENQRTGMAPEAALLFFALTDENTSVLHSECADALHDAAASHVDIVNLSIVLGNSCDPNAVYAFEEEAENAYDDGVLVVAAAGNANNLTATSCQIRSPADLIKTVAVSGFDTSDHACWLDYRDCKLVANASARGGSPAVVNGITHPDALSGVDMVAPTRVVLTTNGDPVNGTIHPWLAGGSSTATPHVSGLAALIKDQYLAAGQAWINSPGRLHTVLLAHTDRHFSDDPANLAVDTQQRVTGAHPWYGLGRIKMRLSLDLAHWRNSFSTWSFTSASSDHTYFPFTSPMPAGTEVVKCVMTMSEDMTSKNDISDIDLWVSLRNPDANGNCTASGALVDTRFDDSVDTKSMVAYASNQTTLAGRCVEVILDKVHVTPTGITTHTSCYAAGQGDDE